ncbi:MAG: serine/threonine protein kinase [Planctomycetota bacterium]|nr:serine/threonine protein kinase [Planctomycetota bacterium]
MSETNACPECGGTVPYDAPRGLCPRCLMGAATSQIGGGGPTGTRGGAPGVDRDELVSILRELDLVPADELDRLASDGPDDPVGLARDLVRSGTLTTYQAGALLQGKARGLVIGTYLVLGKLGVGGMGVVFKARHRPSGRIVALKILPPSFGREGEAVRRFRREFQVASRLNHPNIVAAIEASEDRGVHYLTMEYIPGYDLDRLVSNGGPMALKLALHCAIQVARGLEAAHAQGVIHRDIKPGNIMIDPAGAVRVLDLGLARVIAATGGFGQTTADPLTNTGSYMGTVDFLAPEQANDAKSADGRADIYSLACTLYFLLKGKPPFPGDSVLKRLMAHQDRPAPSLRAARPEVPESLEAVYLAMMAKRPADRPQTVSEVVMALEATRSTVREAGDASAELKTFARTAMKRAPARGARGPDDSVYARPKPRPGGLTFDPDLNLEDLIGDYRDEIAHDSIPEQKLPPIVSRPLAMRPRHRNSSAPYVVFGLVVFLVVVAGFVLRPRTEPEPVRPATAAVGASRPAPASLSSLPAPPTTTPRFTALFNGRDLSGWQTHPGQPGHWRVADGVLVGSGPGISHLYTARDDYADLHLRVEARINDGGNSGLYTRASFGAATDVNSPLSPKDGFEAQIYSTQRDSNGRTGSLFASRPVGSRRVVNVTEMLAPPGEWFTLEMIVQGNHVVVKVDGRVTADYTDSDANSVPARGRIALQQFSPVTLVEFRKVEVRELALELASKPVKPEEKGGRILLSEDFSVPHVGWPVSTPEELVKNPEYAHGYGDGVWYCTSRGYAQFYWNAPGGPYPEIEAEFALRVIGNGDADPQGGALIHFIAKVPGEEGDRAYRGFQIRMNGAGRLMLEPSFATAKAYPNGPWQGPIAHAAIRPGGQPNVLKFRIQKRQLRIFADGAPVGDPIVFDWDLTPASMSLGADSWSGTVRAEFDRIEIREYTP